MKFEHLVEINDPMNPLLDTLTREQLWHGLVLRAEQPKLFIPHVTDHLWSLCVEVHFYLGIALIVALFKKNGLYLIQVMIGQNRRRRKKK